MKVFILPSLCTRSNTLSRNKLYIIVRLLFSSPNVSQLSQTCTSFLAASISYSVSTCEHSRALVPPSLTPLLPRIIGIPSTGSAGLIQTIQMFSSGHWAAGILGAIATAGWTLQGIGNAFYYRQVCRSSAAHPPTNLFLDLEPSQCRGPYHGQGKSSSNYTEPRLTSC